MKLAIEKERKRKQEEEEAERKKEAEAKKLKEERKAFYKAQQEAKAQKVVKKKKKKVVEPEAEAATEEVEAPEEPKTGLAKLWRWFNTDPPVETKLVPASLSVMCPITVMLGFPLILS